MEEFQYCATPTSSQFVHQSVLRSSQQPQPQQQAYYSNEPGQLSSLYGATQQYNSNDIKSNTPLRNCLSSNSNTRSSTLPYTYNGTTSSALTSGSLAAASSSLKQEFDLKNQAARSVGTRNHSAASSAVCAMDRLSPYGSYDDSRNGTNLAGLSLDQIFKTNPNDDSDRNDAGRGPTGQEAILLLNQNIECLKQAYANGNNGSLGPSSSPTTSTISNMSNLDVNNQLSSPPTSTSPSSSTDTPSTYGTLTNTILNGALTPPPDNSANSLTNDSVVSSSVYNPYSVKGVQLQHSHHHQSQLASLKLSLNGGNGANLVNLVPSNANANNPANSLMAQAGSHLNSTSTSSSGQMLQQTNAAAAAAANMNMVNILTPSKPLNISELSNCSLMSSTSSSGSSNLDASNAGSNSTGKRARGSKSSTADTDQKDGKYFERRKRNNVAAKKSRDARKQREDEIAIRASFLEKENSILKAQLQTLKDEAQQLRILLAQKKSSTASLASTSSCSNCSNCSAMVAAAAAAAAAANGMQPTNGNGGLVGVGGPVGCHKQSQPGNGLGGMMSHGGYGAPNINNLAAQLNGYEHSDLDKQQVINANSAAAAGNPSIYLQHQNQHRHSII